MPATKKTCNHNHNRNGGINKQILDSETYAFLLSLQQALGECVECYLLETIYKARL